MGQSAGIKRRKRRTGNYNILKNRKAQHRKEQHLHKAGLKFLGLEDADDGQCLMTRLEQGGLVSDLKKFNKIDPKMFIHREEEKHKKKVEKLIRRSETNLGKNLEEKRREKKAELYARRDIALPGPTVKLMSYYLDKYGEDYKTMKKDVRNYDQLTEKQLFRVMQSFKSSRQFIEYLKDRGLLADQTPNDASSQKGSIKPVGENHERPIVKSDESNESEEYDESEEELDPVQQQQEKLHSKITAMEKASKLLKKQITSRTRKAKVPSEDFEEGMESEEEPQNGTENVETVSRQQKKNILTRMRMKKFKKAKAKRLTKEKRKHGL